jgi:hypothetical protein
MNRLMAAGVALAAMLVFPCLMHAVTLGQLDDFEDGTTQNWVINLLGMGSPPPDTLPANVPDGGPGGAGDNFLRLTSAGGDGAGSRLVGIQFQHQWAGNYTAAGVSGIAMDVNNLGTTDLNLRLLIGDPIDAPPENEGISAIPIFVPAGSGWRHIVFPLTPSALTATTGSVVTALMNATELRIYNAEPGGPPARVAAQLGIDNITATAIPEPATALSLLCGIGCLSLHRTRRKKQQ